MNEMGDFLMANISEPCSIDDATLGDIMNVFFHLQPFIQSYFLEEYHTINALVSTLKTKRGLQSLEFSKHMIIDGEGQATVMPHIEFIMDDASSNSLKDAKIVLSDKFTFSGDQRLDDIELKTKFNLLEVMDCVFSEFSHILTSNSEDYVHIWSLE